MNGLKLSNKIIRITSFPRIHITLIGMNNDGYRINGGVGFSISAPKIDVYVEESKNVKIIDERELGLTEQEKTRLQHVLTNSINGFGLKKRIKCIIQGNVLPHYGFGSNTSIYMSCLEALFIINEIKYGNEDIVTSSKRGGTSGIGINTYFEGGFIFDVGIKNDNQLFTPSSIADRNGKTPLVIHKCKLPDWKIGICIPKYIQHKSEQEEIEFFKTHCPIENSSIENVLYEAVYGITSSIIESDYDVFCKSINKIQLAKWNYLQRLLYGEALIELEQIIKSFGTDCVGMSSLGPMLFFTGNDVKSIIDKVIRSVPETICYSTSFNNQGRIINYD